MAAHDVAGQAVAPYTGAVTVRVVIGDQGQGSEVRHHRGAITFLVAGVTESGNFVAPSTPFPPFGGAPHATASG